MGEVKTDRIVREPELVGDILRRRLAEMRDGVKSDEAIGEPIDFPASHQTAKEYIQALIQHLDAAAYTTGMGDILLVTRYHRKPMTQAEWDCYESFGLNKVEVAFFDLFGLKRWPE